MILLTAFIITLAVGAVVAYVRSTTKISARTFIGAYSTDELRRRELLCKAFEAMGDDFVTLEISGHELLREALKAMKP